MITLLIYIILMLIIVLFFKGASKKKIKCYTSKINYISKDFDFKQNSSEEWLMEEDIANDLTYNIDDLVGSIGLGAVDLSETTDITSGNVVIMKRGDNKIYILQKCFIPEVIKSKTKQKYLKRCRNREILYKKLKKLGRRL